MSNAAFEKAMDSISNYVADLQASALQAASPIVMALEECDEDLRKEAIILFGQLRSGKLDEHERYATTALLAEILFPNTDGKGFPGLDLVEAEEIAKKTSAEAKAVLAQMDAEEDLFAKRLHATMATKGLTQAQLAAAIGVGQPAISMMLQRNCRPQKRTVVKLAEALGIAPEELWPDIKQR
ncbi:MAG: helix-turn-helix transcriptional regulator [Gemmataceae bacterium]|nr:helix-turn-helix transcriptional regulator [Gemmataceae bacterium]